jgi:lysozyme family protein
MTFDQAFDRLLGHEGGYTFNQADPGGETKFGISKRSYPNLDIKALTQEQAKSIYMHDYWQPCRIELLPEDMQFDMFDAAVNSGRVQATKWLQMAVGADVDGVLGPKTFNACAGAKDISKRFNGYRLQFMSALPAWNTFGRGWANRIAKNLIGDNNGA